MWLKCSQYVDGGGCISIEPKIDKKPPAASLDDSFLWLLGHRYQGRWWVNCNDDLGLDDLLVYKPDEAHLKIAPPKRAKRGGRSRRHGRPPDSPLVSVALQSSTTALKNPLTPSVVVSDLVVAGETSSDTFLIAHEGLPAPGFSTSTAAGSGSSNKSPTPCSLKLS